MAPFSLFKPRVYFLSSFRLSSHQKFIHGKGLQINCNNIPLFTRSTQALLHESCLDINTIHAIWNVESRIHVIRAYILRIQRSERTCIVLGARVNPLSPLRGSPLFILLPGPSPPQLANAGRLLGECRFQIKQTTLCDVPWLRVGFTGFIFELRLLPTIRLYSNFYANCIVAYSCSLLPCPWGCGERICVYVCEDRSKWVGDW